MISLELFMDILSLHHEGHSIRAIARITGLSRNTIRHVLRGEHEMKRAPSEKEPILEPFEDYLRQRYSQTQLSAVRLLEEIRAMGYEGSIATVRRFLQPLKQARLSHDKVTVRFETPPGQQGQADWAYCGRFEMPEGRRSVYAFVFVLSYSRMSFVCFTTSMKLPTLIESHQQAFRYFNGWPRTILYDNMKQVKLSKDRFNEIFLDFARHYGFTPKTHQPYRPRTKGKVERTVDYVKDSFLKGRSFGTLDELNAAGLHWLETVANVRVHGTTGQRPVDLFAAEQLTAYGSVTDYRYLDPVQRTVSTEAMVHFQGSRYSVPPQYAGQTVSVATAAGQIVIRAQDLVIAEHGQALKAGQCIVDREHLAELWKITSQRIAPPAEAGWQLTGGVEVQQVPLTTYEEVAQ